MSEAGRGWGARAAGLGGGLAAALLGVALASAQASPTLRVASLAQWVVAQHGGGGPELARAVESGVQDRVVFWWQRGRIARGSLAAKGIRVLDGEAARALGARGEARLIAVDPPQGASAWTGLRLAGEPGGQAVIELGGELNTVRQVLETLLVLDADGRLVAVPLARHAVIGSPGVPVVRHAPDRLPADLPFAAVPGGLAVAVVRGLVEAVRDGAMTAGGVADSAAQGDASGDWREADRVLIRAPLGAPAGGRPVSLVLGWKDRVIRPDPDTEFPERVALPRQPLGS